ncbi:MAG TPA: phosphatase PAP2 family protein [Polyangiaceae bacterium]
MAPTLRVRALLRWLGQHELGSLLAISAASLGTWVFVEVADAVGEGGTQNLDRKLLLSLRTAGDLSDPIGPGWLEEVGRDLTALGGVAGLCLLTIAVVGHLLLAHKPRAAAFVAASVTGALLLSLGLKRFFNRPRPDLVPHMSEVLTSSFPSGHSMLSAAVYLTLGALLARLQASLVLKAYILLWALFLAFLIGASRVYVGVHWPSDVLAGWAAGASWAALCWLLARALQRRGEVESANHSAPTEPHAPENAPKP